MSPIVNDMVPEPTDPPPAPPPHQTLRRSVCIQTGRPALWERETRRRLEDIINRVHDESRDMKFKHRVFRCQQPACGYNFVAQSALDEHRAIAHSGGGDDGQHREVKTEPADGTCPVKCETPGGGPTRVKRRKLAADTEFKCDYTDCKRGFQLKSSLKRHVLTSHPNAGTYTSIKPSAAVNTNTDTGAKPPADMRYLTIGQYIKKCDKGYECLFGGQCGHRCDRMSRITEHIKVHHLKIRSNVTIIKPNVKRFKTFSVAAALKRNSAQTLSGQRPKAKPVADPLIHSHGVEREASDGDEEEGAAAVDTGAANSRFKCTYSGCEYGSKHKYNLERHVRRQHREVGADGVDAVAEELDKSDGETDGVSKPFVCDVDDCGRGFSHWRSLQRHFRREHNMSAADISLRSPTKATNSKVAVKPHPGAAADGQPPADPIIGYDDTWEPIVAKQEPMDTTAESVDNQELMDTSTGAHAKRLTCDVCNTGKAYSSLHSLRRHKATMHGLPYNDNTSTGSTVTPNKSTGRRKKDPVSDKQPPKETIVGHNNSEPIVVKQEPIDTTTEPIDNQKPVDSSADEKAYQCQFPGCVKGYVSRYGLMKHIKSIHKRDDSPIKSPTNGTAYVTPMATSTPLMAALVRVIPPPPALTPAPVPIVPLQPALIAVPIGPPPAPKPRSPIKPGIFIPKARMGFANTSQQYKCQFSGCDRSFLKLPNLQKHMYVEHKAGAPSVGGPPLPLFGSVGAVRPLLTGSPQSNVSQLSPNTTGAPATSSSPTKTAPAFAQSAFGTQFLSFIQSNQQNKPQNVSTSPPKSPKTAKSPKSAPKAAVNSSPTAAAPPADDSLDQYIRKYDQENFECLYEDCGQPFKRKAAITAHIKSVHLKIKRFKCTADGCSYESAQNSHMTRHLSRVHKTGGAQ